MSIYALEVSLQWMGYPTLGPTLVSTQSVLIPNSTMPLVDTGNFQAGYE